MRRVISLWLPRFPTDRLSRRQPEWRSEPLATVIEGRAGQAGPRYGGRRGGAGGGLPARIAAANRAAERAGGIVAGLTVSDARARLPDLRTVPAEPEADRRALAALADWCTRWTPWSAVEGAVEGGGPGAHGAEPGTHAIWLDITGCAHLFGGEAALMEDLVIRLTRFGFSARAALADTPGAAWAVSHFGARKPVRIVRRGGTRAALAPLPVAALRLDAATIERLERLGLTHVSELLSLPRNALARRFGATVLERLDQALGRAPEPLSPHMQEAPYRVHLTYAEPIAHRDAVAVGARQLLTRLEARLAEAGLGARRLALLLYRVDGKVERVEIGTSAPARATKHLMRLLDEKLDEIVLGFGVDLMVLDAPVTEPLHAAQPTLDGIGHAPPEARSDEIARLVDRLGNRFGLANVHCLAPRASHLPERAQEPVAALADGPAPRGAWQAGTRRPLRLLSRPEPVEAVAMVPDDPPVMFRWRRVVHRVVKADGPERIGAEWWRDENAGAEDALRDYYRVEDVEGRRFWLYRDAPYQSGRTPGWWLHGIFA